MADTKDTQSVENPVAETEQAEAVAEEQAVEAVAVEEASAVAEADASVEEIVEAEQEVGVVADEAATTESGPQIPEFRAGDTLRLGLRIKEGEKVRIQYFEGIVLARKGAGVSQTFTIRKIAAGGVAVERIFPVYSPTIVSWEVRRRGVVRRAKIYFLRDIVGSTANVIKERKVAKEMQQVQEARAARKAAKAAKKGNKPAAEKKTKSKGSTRSASRAARKSN
jgi:large subunit ribosomal protein L19